MFVLTEPERRGALVLLLLVLLASLWDLLHLRPVPAPPVPDAGTVGTAPPDPAGGAGVPPATAAPLDLNAADARQLDALPGIGPVLAARIVAHRETNGPFRSPDELQAVRGIGPRLLARLRPLVTAGGARRAGAGRPVQIATRARR